MTVRNYSNLAQRAELTASASAAALTIQVDTIQGWPEPPFIARIDKGTPAEELVLVTDVDVLELTVTRGFDQTEATLHARRARVEHVSAAIDFREANEHANDVDPASTVHGGPFATLAGANAFAAFQQFLGGASFGNGDAVLGSRGGNAALASLLAVLDSIGLIDDQTTP